MTTSQPPLETSLKDAAAACKRYRDYIANNYKEGYEDGHISYLLNREDLDVLLQKGTLHGIRVYIGYVDKDNGPLVRPYIVGCKMGEDGRYEDVLNPNQLQPNETTYQTNIETPRQPEFKAMNNEAEVKLTSGRPCPSECGGRNELNS